MNPTTRKIILAVGKLTDILLTILSWVLCPVLTFCILPVGYFDPRKRIGLSWVPPRSADNKEIIYVDDFLGIATPWLGFLFAVSGLLYLWPVQTLCTILTSVLLAALTFCYQLYKEVEEE